jgi:hypothetical protein
VTAIGQPFEPVAPFIGTGEKMNTNRHFRSTISSSHDHVLVIDDAALCLQFPHTCERQAFVGIGHHFDSPGVGTGQRAIPDAGLAAVKAMMFCIRNRPQPVSNKIASRA